MAYLICHFVKKKKIKPPSNITYLLQLCSYTANTHKVVERMTYYNMPTQKGGYLEGKIDQTRFGNGGKRRFGLF